MLEMVEVGISTGNNITTYLIQCFKDSNKTMNDEKFKTVEKINTIGNTFMAASGKKINLPIFVT